MLLFVCYQPVLIVYEISDSNYLFSSAPTLHLAPRDGLEQYESIGRLSEEIPT